MKRKDPETAEQGAADLQAEPAGEKEKGTGKETVGGKGSGKEIAGAGASQEEKEPEQPAQEDETPDGGKETGGDAEDTEESGEHEEQVPEGEDEKSWAEKRAAKKQARQDKKTDALKEQIGQLEDRVKRQTEREKQSMFETGARSVIEKILPVVDNFERGLATVPEENSGDPFVEGMNRVYRQLLTELDNIGVKPIEAVGQEFDPNLHNAVMQVASEEYESGVVVQELQKGYTYRDVVVRHSMVAVVE